MDPRAIGAFLVMSALTFASAYATWYFSEREATAEFRSRAALIQEAITSRMQSYLDLLNQTRGFFDATGKVTRERFRTYVQSVRLQENFPGAMGLGFAAKRGNGFPIQLLEPEVPQNREALGYDMYSDPDRRAAMDEAMRTGEAAATGKVRLIQSRGPHPQSGFLIYLPVFGKGPPVGTPEERVNATVGFVYCAFFSDDFFNSIIRQNIDRDLKMDFEIYSAPKPSPGALLHEHARYPIHSLGDRYRSLAPLNFLGNRWSIYFHSLPGFRSQFSTAVSWVILLVGMVLSVLLSWNFWLIRVREAGERAQRERLEFLYLTTRDLVEPLSDPQEVLVRLSRALVHRIADWVVCLSLPELTGTEQSAWRISARDPSIQSALESTNLDRFLGIRRVAREGRVDHVELFSSGSSKTPGKTSGSTSSGAFELSFHVTIRSYLCVPLQTANRKLGAIALGISGGKRRFIAEDVTLVSELASRAALAIENAILYRNSLEAVQLRDTFMSIASHELKTPLTTLRLQNQMAQRFLEGAPPEIAMPKLERLVDSTDKQVSRLVRLVDDMLDVARIRAGKLQLEPSRFDLADLARETLDRLREQFKSAGTPLSRVQLESVVGTWDRFRIEQVMTNLLTNAMKYGLGRPVEVDLRKVADRAVFSVVDHGIGIASEAQSRIFQRFERAVSARNISGLGLGLFIVREIVEAHGGNIRVESQPGRGSTFSVELPLRIARPAAQ